MQYLCFIKKGEDKMGKIIKRILLGILIVILLVVVIFLVGAWSIFGDKIKAAGTVKAIDDNLYYMEYKGDYGFDAYLEQGGASSASEMAVYITDFLSGGFMSKAPAMGKLDFGCTAYTVKTADGGALMGRNYDWEGENGTAMIMYTEPENGYASYSTCWLDFLGFGKDWKPEGTSNQYMSLAAIYVPLDGINEKGLAIADLMVGDDEQTNQKTDKVDLTTTTAIRLLLDKAATVDEAVELLGQYDMNSDIGRGHHLAISDATGKSVVVEYIDNVMYVTETPVVTNHYLTEGEKYGIGNDESHARLDRVLTFDAEAGSVMNATQVRNVMQNVSYADATQWSIVFDMKNKALDFYWQRQFDAPHRFEIK